MKSERGHFYFFGIFSWRRNAKVRLSHARQQQSITCENVDYFDELSGLYLSINKKKVVLKNALTIVHKIVYKEQFT